MSPFPARALAGAVLLAALFCGDTAYAQGSPTRPQQPASPAPLQRIATRNNPPQCIQPPPMVRLRDYNGPFEKTVGLFARKLELRATQPPHYQPGLVLCSLDTRDKFVLFVRDSYNPITFFVAGVDAGFDQLTGMDPGFGPGIEGYGKRFGASYTDQVSFNFFKDFAYPSIFREDPRYYPLLAGTKKRRLLHAVNHAFVAHRDNGEQMFNFSEWLGTASADTLSNFYHPRDERGVASTAEQVGINIGTDIGFDMLREFWPEIAHKLKLPFLVDPVPVNYEPNPAPQ